MFGETCLCSETRFVTKLNFEITYGCTSSKKNPKFRKFQWPNHQIVKSDSGYADIFGALNCGFPKRSCTVFVQKLFIILCSCKSSVEHFRILMGAEPRQHSHFHFN